jgi:hypothetical protein
LRPSEDGVDLQGATLEKPVFFREADSEQRAINLVGFSLAARWRFLRIFDAAGADEATP